MANVGHAEMRGVGDYKSKREGNSTWKWVLGTAAGLFVLSLLTEPDFYFGGYADQYATSGVLVHDVPTRGIFETDEHWNHRANDFLN